MKSIINTIFVCISLAVALCSTNVSSFCGNDEQIDGLRTTLLTQEGIYTALTTLSAIPVTGATLAFAQVALSTRYAVHLHEAFDEMEKSLDKDHKDYEKCSEILEMSVTATTIMKSFSFGMSMTSMIPGVGLAFLIPRLFTSISAMAVIRERLVFWKDAGCQYATTRDCNL
ncbi:uncharacterized protein LOC115034587 isoform X1 [Acyrthosiphon pisum]|uniref:Uncharacterized protein n=1 Tax=Acyrthosiphon pisum TaxID=7029 RepID=A0A8R2JW77_ACYPI|nr:uncharacterized protein LOC115034587 isoform X1 [Acyrthosiphon pisum]